MDKGPTESCPPGYDLRPRMPRASRWLSKSGVTFLLILFELIFWLTLALSTWGIPEDPQTGDNEALLYIVLVPPTVVALPLLFVWGPLAALTWLARNRFRRHHFRVSITPETVCITGADPSFTTTAAVNGELIAQFASHESPMTILGRFTSVRINQRLPDGESEPVEGIALTSNAIGSDEQHADFAAWLATQGVVTCCTLDPRTKRLRSLPLRETVLAFVFTAAIWAWCLYELLAT